MTPKQLQWLQPGARYTVRMSQGRAVDRIFKWLELRPPFDIPCAVFTSRVQGPLTVEVLAKDHLRMSGQRIPTGELSIPHYDLLACDLLAMPATHTLRSRDTTEGHPTP